MKNTFLAHGCNGLFKMNRYLSVFVKVGIHFVVYIVNSRNYLMYITWIIINNFLISRNY